MQVLHVLEAAVDREAQLGEVGGEAVHQLWPQRRHLAVGVGRQPAQHRPPRVHHKVVDAAALVDRLHELRELGVHGLLVQLRRRLLVIGDPDAALDRHGQAAAACDGRTAVGHKLRVPHERGPKGALACHAVAGATAVEVDRVVPPRCHFRSRKLELLRLRSAELEDCGTVRLLLAQEALELGLVAVHERVRCDHLCV